VLACVAAGVKPNEEGADDPAFAGGEYEIVDVVNWRKRKFEGQEIVEYQVIGKGYEHVEWWEQRPSFQDEDGNDKPYFTEFYNTKLTDAQRAKIAPIEAAAAERAAKAAADPTAKKKTVLSREELVEVKLSVHQDREEAKVVQQFDDDGKADNTVFVVPRSHNGEWTRDLVLCRRQGKFTDRVKAIRRFLIDEAKKERDTLLLETLVLRDPRSSEKRQMRFPMDPEIEYEGLPWFSLPTSATEPHTDILHTMSCRNLLDPEDTNRNWAEIESYLWDFDVITKAKVYINRRFRFCKECKEYSGDPVALVPATRNKAPKRTERPPQRTTSPPPRTAERPKEPAAAPPQREPSQQSISSRTSSHSSSSTVVSVRSLPASELPITDLVSFFAMRAAMM
jgi:hypothetical protein